MGRDSLGSFNNGLLDGLQVGQNMMLKVQDRRRQASRDDENDRRWGYQQELLEEKRQHTKEDRDYRDGERARKEDERVFKETALFFDAYKAEKDPKKRASLLQDAVDTANTDGVFMDRLGVGGKTGRHVVGVKWVPEAKAWSFQIANRNFTPDGQPADPNTNTNPAVGPATEGGSMDGKDKVVLFPQTLVDHLAGRKAKGQKWKTFGNTELGFYGIDEESGVKKELVKGLGRKPTKGDGSGSGNGKTPTTAQYKLMDDELKKLMLGIAMKENPDLAADQIYMTDPNTGARSVNMDYVLKILGPGSEERYHKARSQAEHFLIDDVAPYRAAQSALEAAGSTLPPGTQFPATMKTLEPTPENVAGVFANLEANQIPTEQYKEIIDQVREVNPPMAQAMEQSLPAPAEAGAAPGAAPVVAGGRLGKYTGGLEKGKAPTPAPQKGLGSTMAHIPGPGTNPEAEKQAAKIRQVFTAPVKWTAGALDQIADYFFVNPAKALANDAVVKPLQAFQRWGRNRYKNKEASPEQMIAEYAEVNPEGAQQLLAQSDISQQER